MSNYVRETAIHQLQERLERLEAEFANQDMDYPRKLFLIENCIYGVDIQNIAVQIAKLRCFIALIVEQTVDDYQPNRGIFPLPNLEMKFVAANTLFALEKAEQLSLLGSDIALKEKEAELEQLRHDYFQTYDLGKKRRLKEKDEALRAEIATLLQSQNVSKSSAEKIAYWKPYDQLAEADFFDPHWMFGIEDGFDIVIGNPPYVRHEKLGSEYKVVLKQNFPGIYSGTADLYTYFYGCSLALMKSQGVLAFITSNKWFKANYGKPLRKYISANCQVCDIIDFGELSVFDAATFPMIFLAKKSKKKQTLTRFTQVTSLEPPYPDVQALIKEKGEVLSELALSGENWQFASADVTACLDKMKAVGKPLEKYVDGKIFYGVKTGFNKAFVIDAKTRAELIEQDPKNAEIIKPLSVGDDIRKWHIRDKDRWLIFIPWHFPLHNDSLIKGASAKAEKLFKARYSAIYTYLLNFKDKLASRNQSETGIRYEWYALQRCAATYEEFFQLPKIIFPDIAKESRFSFDTDGRFINDTTFMIPIKDLYLMGILNSKLAWHYLSQTAAVLGDPGKNGRLRLKRIYVSQIPIPPASDADKAVISALVQKCLDAKGQGVAQWEAEIDDRVAHLYGLTPYDLKIIHGD
ncbi:Eco57I restriction-modification methylase domain-containing protein [Nodosilinea sp. AN01ver1]|uniref:Eco57I restriction-modification methylase domain-containing protein n=1 Tax=Nodosilinea sp. AN01ver1 TaxID=3423362 RepID=UPI003D311946